MYPKILTVGSAYYCMDVDIPSVPSNGGTASVKELVKYPGGTGVNTAVALQKLDADCVPVLSLGSDSNGTLIKDYLSSMIGSMMTVHIEKGASVGTTIKLTDVDGGVRLLEYDGANSFLSVGMVEDAFSSCPDGVIVNGDMPQEIVNTAILAANTHKIPSLVNLRGRQAGRLPIDQFRDGTILVMDQDNVQRYCGMRVQSVDDCLKACISLQGKVRSKCFVIRLAGKGAFAYNGKFYYFVPNYDFVPENRRGAEEYYNVALFLRYLFEDDIQIACEFAAVAETVVMLRKGGALRVPDYEDIRRFVIENELDPKLLIG